MSLVEPTPARAQTHELITAAVPSTPLVMRVTAYCLRGYTASGWWVRPGAIAAPRGWAFGTRLYVDGYGYGTVLDRGGAIGYGRLDVWMPSCYNAIQWGVRYVNVWRVYR